MPRAERETASAPPSPSRSPSPLRASRVAWIASVALGVVALAWMAAAGARLTRTLSPTVDEPGHLGAGLSYRHDDYRQSTNGNLFFTQEWAAWPLALHGVNPPDPAIQARAKWQPNLIGAILLFSGANDPGALLTPARRMTLGLCLLGGVMVWAWAAWLAGPWAGALAALLYATSPVILANGVLVTTDMGASFWYVAALLGYAWMLRRPHALSAAAAGICGGMMLLSKFSFVAWLLAAGLLLGWELWRHRADYRLPKLAGWHVGAGVIAWLTIWIFFGGTYRPGGFTYLPATFVPMTALEHVVVFLNRWHALPEPYLRETLSLQNTMQARPGYLFGEYRMGGHWLYFPIAFLTKSTVAALLALAAGLVLPRLEKSSGHPASRWIAPLVAGALGYILVVPAASVNIGVRHILPLFLLATVAGGVILARVGRTGPKARAVVIALALLAGAEGLSASRQPLAWFNFPVGGPMAGYRIMVDSSLEWGGDLPDLLAWEQKLRTKDAGTPVYVSVLGPPGAEHFGLPADDMEEAFMGGRIHAGYFVFSATRLIGGPEKGDQAGSESREQGWNAYVAPAWRSALPRAVAQVGVGRLAAFCRKLTPTERIGPVYFVYRLDEAALDAALGPKGSGR